MKWQDLYEARYRGDPPLSHKEVFQQYKNSQWLPNIGKDKFPGNEAVLSIEEQGWDCPELVFDFKRTKISYKDAQHFAINYMKTHKLPFTEIDHFIDERFDHYVIGFYYDEDDFGKPIQYPSGPPPPFEP